MAPPRRPSPAQVRERRARVFLIIAVIQGPKLLKALNGGSSASPPPATSTTAATTAAGPATTGASVSFTTGGAPSTAGQLDGFSLLASKDPFHSQLPATTPAGGTQLAPATAKPSKPATKPPTTKSAATQTAPGQTAPGQTTPGQTAPAPAFAKQPVTTATTAPAATTPVPMVITPTPPSPAGPLAAIVKMNGHRQTLFAGAAFPVKQPLFRIISLGKKRVEIGLVTGSFADGGRTLSLVRGRKLTLLDRSDGSRFVFVFEQVTHAVESTSVTPTKASVPATGTASTTTTTTTTTTTAAG